MITFNHEKTFGILVLGLLWCNVGVAEKTAEQIAAEAELKKSIKELEEGPKIRVTYANLCIRKEGDDYFFLAQRGGREGCIIFARGGHRKSALHTKLTDNFNFGKISITELKKIFKGTKYETYFMEK